MRGAPSAAEYERCTCPAPLGVHGAATASLPLSCDAFAHMRGGGMNNVCHATADAFVKFALASRHVQRPHMH